VPGGVPASSDPYNPRVRTLLRRIWDSAVLRGPLVPRSDRERTLVTLHTLVLHLRPVRLPARTLHFTHTFGLGGSALALIGVLALTGILMMLVYQPAPGIAYDSVVTLEGSVRFGSLVRGIHHWSAQLLVVVLALHVARVFLTGGYHGPRQFNWVVGAALLASVLANAFTGYLLPWDQLSYWAVTISIAMLGYVPGIGALLQRVVRGGAEIGPATLTVFYTVHTSIVPTLLVFLTAFHFWRVRKAGGVVVPPPALGEASPAAGTTPSDGEPQPRAAEPQSEGERVLFLPHLLVREVAFALVLLAVVSVLGAAVGASLGERANPGLSPNPTKAPWYFMGVQELLVHFHPVFAVVIIPLLAIVGFVLLPYLTADDEPAGSWFLSKTGRRTAALAAAASLLATPLLVLAHAAVGDRLPATAGWITGGLVPLGLILAATAAFARLVRRRYAASPNETTQAVVVLLSVAFAVLTFIGVVFRGKGMALAWPWAS
jgi:quinol-cytochrome oxidoreductase complex cytochrome b subunit